ncbi:MAG: MopE-related protein [Phycisphaerae bacterium]
MNRTISICVGRWVGLGPYGWATVVLLQTFQTPVLFADDRWVGNSVPRPGPVAHDAAAAATYSDEDEPNAAAANLLRNPSFEAVPGPQQGEGLMPNDWVIIASTPDTYSNNGSYGLLPQAFGNFPGVLARDGIRWVAAWGTTTPEVFGQQLSSPLLPNQTYHITAWLHQALRSDVAHPGTYELLLALSPPTPQNAVVLGRFPATTVPQWEQRSLEFMAPSDSTSRPWLIFRPVPTGTVPSTYPGLDALNLEPGSCGPEQCNGLDDDCDGSVDEGNPGGGVTCATGLPGVCAMGTTECVSGAIVCKQNNQPAAELCNGLDDDCDGSVDEGNPGGGVTCNTGLPGVCAMGTTECVSGAIVCKQNSPPAAELCNGLDDDCDGSVDDGNPGGGVTCNTGLQGVCAIGTTQCQGGAIVCIQNNQPTAESCNNLDDDCDGSADEGNPGGGATCSTGLPGVCGVGILTCLTGAIVCRQNTQPSTELCNNLDDDCDAQIDEGFVQMQFDPQTGGTFPAGPGAPCVAGSGICETPGTLQCKTDGSGLRCVPLPGEIPLPQQEGPYGNPSCFNLDDDDCDGLVDHDDPDCQGVEICDGFDNDGNGQVDELWPTLGQPCWSGFGSCEQPGVWRCAATGQTVICSAQPLEHGIEGPPDSFSCDDGFDNDCDGLRDIRDPDCQSPEICDKKDNNGNGQVDENFPLLGQLCTVGLGECERDGFFDCTADGTGVRCSAPPGQKKPEGVGCHCGDGLDNDCDGLVDKDDPDCGGSSLLVRASLRSVCRHPDGDCHSWHVIDWTTLNAGPNLTETAELLALGTDGTTLGSVNVARGDLVRITSRDAAAMAQWSTHSLTADLDYFGQEIAPCLSGPDVEVTPRCTLVDTDCDLDVDLGDLAWFQNHLNETIAFHEIIAPRPLLRVVANDGWGKATAYASPVPQVRVWSPEETVVSVSDGNRLRVEVALPQVDLATLEVFIDGVPLFPALGLVPGIAFPGGPYDGTVTLSNDCVAEVCGLAVDAADLDTPAANALTMYVEGMCCGGHRFVARGAQRANAYPDPVPPSCAPTDTSDDGVSYGFEVTILSPADGGIVATPVSVVGLACHGVPLECPIPAADRRVRLNGELFPMNPPTFTPGDGVFTADTYRYSFQGLLPQTDLFDDMVLGNGVAGRLDPGGNKLIAEVTDPMLNTTFDIAYIGVGSMTPNPRDFGVVAGGGGSAIPHGFSATATSEAFQTAAVAALRALAPLAVQTLANMLDGLRGTEVVVPTDPCAIQAAVLVDNPVPYEFTMNADGFTYDVTLLDNQVDLLATSGPIHAAGSVRGSCQLNLFGACLIRVTLRAGAEVDIDAAALSLSVTEDDLINRTPLQPALQIADDDVQITVLDVESDLGCWGGDLLDVISFGVVDGLLSDLVRDRAQEFINDLDVAELLGLLPVPAVPLTALDFDPVNIATLNVDFDFGLTEVEISPEGISVGFQTEFIPTEIDPEVPEFPGTPDTVAALPLPPLPDPPASGLTALIADDAVNQLFQALTRNGIIKTRFEDQRQIEDLLPADCSVLPPGAYGVCEALKGTTCTTIADLVEQAACAAATAVLAPANISGETTILLQGRVDAPPKLFAFAAQDSVLTAYIRLSQAYVGIVADRDGDGEFNGDYTSLPSCLAGNLGTTTECAIWGACFDVTFTATLTLDVLPDGDATLMLDLTAADLSAATGCSGGTVTPGGANGLEAIFEGPVFALIRNYIDNNVPPLAVQGLDFGGIITLQDLRPITYGNEFDPVFEDTFGVTADVAAGP